MDKQEYDSVQTFDTQYTNNHIQIMKILLPFLEPDLRKFMTILIRFMELQYTIFHVQSHPEYYTGNALPFSLDTNMEQFRKYCPPQFSSLLENFYSIQNAMSMYEEMKDMMSMFGNGEDADIQDLFQMFQNTQSPNE